MKRQGAFLLGLSATLTLLACGHPVDGLRIDQRLPSSHSELYAVFDGDLKFEVLGTGDPLEQSVGSVEDSALYGTGFVIQGHRIVTNFHIAKDCTYEKCELKFRGKFPLRLISKRLVSDLAVLELVPEDGAEINSSTSFKPLSITGSFNELSNFDIIQSGTDFIGSKDLVKTVGSGFKVEETHYGHELSYTASTKPGSSGSPVINEKGEVFAIHKGFDPDKKVNLATALTDQSNLISGNLLAEFDACLLQFESGGPNDLKYDLVEIYRDSVEQKKDFEAHFSARIKTSVKSTSLRLYFEGIRKIALK